jgi:hypothetical protein
MTGESMIREKKGGETRREGVKEKKNKEEKGGGRREGGEGEDPAQYDSFPHFIALNAGSS